MRGMSSKKNEKKDECAGSGLLLPEKRKEQRISGSASVDLLASESESPSIAESASTHSSSHKKRQLPETERPAKSKQRCQWSEANHRKFVAEIFEVGMLHASPTLIQQYMLSNAEGLTSEKIKSHLQKFRNKQEKSKEEFMALYDEIYAKLKTHYIKSCENNVKNCDVQGGNMVVTFPCFSDQEMNTPFGASLALLKGLYYSVHAEILQQNKHSH
jgi:SHAQKYF class myb-like DNA-binding protein